ncbi:PREDICTED: GLABROUS1 enhancer-binding protein-like 3 [Camelina sativa]|uniref:GLABROUS1 enhancer-binding protein-like 3 n=1 Tax=Camelina sativa TaxID=90675 RepID=A0ABM0U5C4_CAMSA|nr:PREDICTED: GLABROUS1 enhancer-binding protein-like 3 [Camelina sativa]
MKRGSDSSEDSSSDYFVIRHNPQPLTKRKHEDDEEISGTEAMLRKRKQLKTRKTLLEASSSGACKMNWTITEELLILKETKASYMSDWNAVYDRIRGSMESDFSKRQLQNKIEKMKLRFRDYQTRSSAGKRLSFTNAHDKQVFRLSMAIWGEIENNKTKSASNENINMDQRKVWVSNATDDGEKDKSEDLNVLQEALEVAASFRSLGNHQQRSLLRNLKNLGATQRKELTHEWKALLAQDMQLGIKKQSFYAKLVNAGFSA